jgi:hypothetical protein
MVTEGSQRTYLHDNHGPRVVDAGQLRGATRRPQKDTAADDREAKRTRRTSSHKSPSKSESGHRRKSSNSQSSMKSSVRPKWELDVIGQPNRVVPLGMEVETSVMASLRFPTADHQATRSRISRCRHTRWRCTGRIWHAHWTEAVRLRPRDSRRACRDHGSDSANSHRSWVLHIPWSADSPGRLFPSAHHITSDAGFWKLAARCDHNSFG